MADPYKLLGVSRTATDDEIRAAYRKLVKATHPDHNAGSPEAAKRFEAVQSAYAEIQRLRKDARAATPPKTAGADPDLEARMADLESQVREAQRARERAQKAAREAAGADQRERATDEELGYVTTDDSLSSILADARTELSTRYAHAREHPVVRRVSDLIAGLEELTEKLDRRER